MHQQMSYVHGAHSVPLIGETISLKNGDVIELAGTQMQFVHG